MRRRAGDVDGRVGLPAVTGYAKFVTQPQARLSFCEQTAYNLGNEFIAWETLQ